MMRPFSRWLRHVLPVLILMRLAGVAAGQTLAWEPTAGPPGGTITALFEAPTGTLLAGTETAGVFRSDDGGETWGPSFEGMGGVRVTAITAVVDTLFVATYIDGVYRSDDDGRTWVRTGYWRWRTSSLVSAGDILVAADEGATGLLQSQDLGVSWTFLPTDGHSTLDLAAAGTTLYVSGRGPDRKYRTLRSRDGGRTWEALFRKTVPVVFLVRAQGPTIFAVHTTQILRSDDEGDNWTRLGNASNVVDIAPVGDRLYVATSHKGILQFSTEELAVAVEVGPASEPTVLLPLASEALVGTATEGLWLSHASGTAWRRLHLVNRDTHDLAAGGGAVYVTTDEKQVYITHDAGATWTLADQGTGGLYVAAIAADGDLVYASLWLGDLLRSVDGGATWSVLPNASVGTTLAVVGDSAILVGSGTGVTLYRVDTGAQSLVAPVGTVSDLGRTDTGYIAGAGAGVYLSNADGTTWRPTGLAGVRVQHVHSDSGVLWAVTSSDMLRSADDGETWARLGIGSAAAPITDFASGNGYLYVATADGGFASADLGNSWTAASDGLPAGRAPELLAHQGILYAATRNLGVYRSPIPPPIATPTVAILSPAPAQTLPEAATEAAIRIAAPLGASEWRWQLDTPFASSGAAGGSAGDLAGADAMSGLASGTHTLFVTLVDGSGDVLTPEARDSVTFHVAADADVPASPQRVRHAYDVPQGLSIFSPVLDGDRIRTPDVSLDVSAGSGGLRASHLAAIGSTVVVDLGEEGFRTAIARDGRILYGQDFPLSGERGYVVNFRTPLSFTLEGEPFGTPIISDAVAQAPSRASPGVWALALAARVAEPQTRPHGLRIIARNLRTGERRTGAVGPGGVAVLAFVDAGREPVVTAGDTLVVDVVAQDGWVVGSWSTSVDGALLADAHTVADISATPGQSTVLPNYPNPFNPETWIPFELARAGDVTVTLYDAAGHRIRSLDLGRQEAGYHGAHTGAVRWDGRNEHGEPAASGAYIAELRSGDDRSARRIVLAR